MQSKNINAEQIIKQLQPLAKKQSYNIVRKYQNHQLSTIFNPEEVGAIAEDIMLEIANKYILGQIDHRGMFNYFKTSLNNKCIDLFIAHSKTIKRGNVQIENKDLSEIHTQTQMDLDPERIIQLSHHLDSIINHLKQHDKGNAKYSQIFEMMLQQRTSKDIQDELKLSSSSFDRHKHKTIDLVKNIIIDEHFEINLEPNIDSRYYLNNEQNKKEIKILPMLEKNFYKEQIKLQLKVVIEQGKERKEIIIEEYLISNYETEKIEQAYLSLSTKAKNTELISQLLKGVE
jgi:hypothetical protein